MQTSWTPYQIAMSSRASVLINKGSLQGFLKANCSVCEGRIVVTKKILLDLLERFLLRGPVGGEKQQSTSRATLSRKLSRALGKVNDSDVFRGAWNFARSEHDEVTYSVDAVRAVLLDFDCVLPNDDWSDICGSLSDLLSAASVRGRQQQVNESDAGSVADSSASVLAPADVPSGLPGLAAPLSVSALTHGSAGSGRGLKRKQSGGFDCSFEDDEFKRYQHMFGAFSWTDLLKEVVQRDKDAKKQESKLLDLSSKYEELKKKNRLLTQQTRRIKKAAEKARAKLHGSSKKQTQLKFHRRDRDGVEARKQASIEEKMAIQRTGPSGSGRYLTVPSRVSLSIRRNLSNIACGDLSLVLLDDASRWTVARAEVHSGACLLAAARAFHQNMLAEIAEKPSSGFDDSKGLSQPAVCIHSISQDATNSAIWQKRKLSALILESAFCPSLPSKEDLGASGIELANVFQMMQCVADCQPVGDSSAAGTVALTHKMLGSLGCPSVQSLLESPLAEKGSTSGHFSTGSVHAYIMTTDRGPNEVLARKMWNVLAKDAPHILFFTNDCFEHAIHLITLSSLKTIDGLLRRFGKGFKFFSSLATASNTLRDVSKALFEKWCEIHGDKSGMQHAKKLWPKAVGGRNSITEVEQRMLDIGGMSMMLPVLLEVLKKKDKDKDNKKDLPPNDDVVDEISFDATKQYQRNMGAWRKKTLECAQDPLWWVLSETMRLAQSPGTHVSAFLKVTLSDQELEQKGQTIAQLVDGRSESFLEEFSGIFHSSAGQISNHPDWPELSSGEKQFILNTLALMLFQNASGFQRRIHSQVQSFPLVILSMGRVRYDLPCMRRQELAKTMLQEATTTNTVLDVNTLKVIRMFKQDISMASENGQIGFGFFVFIKALRRLWRGDVRENERLNKQLKLYGSRAPNSSLELISSRLCLKFKLGARGFNESRHPLTKKPSKSVTRNWSNVRSLASSVFDDCMEHWVVGASEVLSQDKRFAEVSPEPWCPTRKEVHKWTPLLFGGCKPTAATATATAGSDSVEQGNLKRSQVIAAAVNRTLSRFLTSGSDPSKTAASAAAPESHGPAPGQPEQLPPLPFPEHMFSAVSLVPGSVDKNRPYRLPTGATLYIFCEIVNRSVRFLEATWTGSRIAVKQPWTFRWAVDLILQAHGAMKAGDPPILVMAFPIAWMLAESTAGVGLEGSCVSRTGSVPFVTVTHWEEVCILQKAGIKRMDPRVQVNKPPPSSSDIDDGSDSGSSRSSSDSKHQANQPATTKPSKPAPAGKPEPKRRPRKQPADDEVVQIGWLSELFNELQPGEAEESSVTVVNASDSETESAKTKPLVEKAQALVEEAFGPTNNMSLDQDEIEIQEDDFTKEVISESGLDVMAVREQQILEKACEEFASSTEFTAKESVFLEDNLADSIAELVQQGASPEDAAEELMLSHLIGNGIEEPRKPEASASSFSAASSSVPSFAAPSSHHLSTALSTWLQECVISLRALQLRGKAVSEKTVGQQSELSLVYGHVKGDADQSESPSIFWVHWRDASQRWGRPASLDQNCRVKCIVATGSLRDPRDYTSTTIIHPAVGARMERVRGYAGGQRPKVPDDVMRVHSICQRALVARDEQEQLHISLQNPGESSFSKFLKSAPDSTECCFICQQHRCPRMGPEDRDSNSDSLAPVLVLCPICLLPSHPGCCQAVATYAKGDEDEDDVSAMSVSFPSDIQLDAIDLPLSHLFEPQSRRSILCPLCAAFAFPDLAGGADHGHQEEEADGRNEDEGEREGNHGQPAGENIPADVGRPAIAAAAGVKELA